MQVNRIKKSIIYLLILLVYIYSTQWLLKYFHNIKGKTFIHFPYFYSSIIISILFGMIINIDYIVNEIKKQGKWKVNLEKLVLVGIPSLFLIFYETIYYLMDFSFLPSFLKLILYSESFEIFTSILLGHILITSIYKE
ncbi:MAG: hypothetical protein PWR27_1405 [Petroclostridium sp.]|uniref:hypothetical protein n=1 Tax=Petroclostridium xylanilyticum TaxID=1792311 RepID=UPI000B990829|nr:hypothetical protein [Petroclostridium xylanilyticum]MBZ4645459.1 hypothetical protein [Clostridia bacterium]MDK2810696.1 hypothetical protein [Petroclostridium sp.]